MTLLLPAPSQGGKAEREVLVFAPWEPMTGSKEMAQSWAWGGSDWTLQKKFFTLTVNRGVKHWNRHPSEVVDARCLSVFKRHLDNAVHNRLFV